MRILIRLFISDKTFKPIQYYFWLLNDTTNTNYYQYCYNSERSYILGGFPMDFSINLKELSPINKQFMINLFHILDGDLQINEFRSTLHRWMLDYSVFHLDPSYADKVTTLLHLTNSHNT